MGPDPDLALDPDQNPAVFFSGFLRLSAYHPKVVDGRIRICTNKGDFETKS
jgi:hypothetical protein